MERHPTPLEKQKAQEAIRATLVAYESYLTERISQKLKNQEIDQEQFDEWIKELADYDQIAQFEGFAEQELNMTAENLNRAVAAKMNKLEENLR